MIPIGNAEGEYARDEDDDSFHEVHVNTMRKRLALLRSRLRSHRSISQEYPPLYLSFFELTHKLRQRSKAFFELLIATLLQPSIQNRK